MSSEQKAFVLDTNVILHDSSCIYHFHQNDIVIPITVLEELDHFKKGGQEINYHAREFLRALDSLTIDKLFNGGVAISSEHGRISVKLEQDLHPVLKNSFHGYKPDHAILNTAYHLFNETPDRPVILVSKDVNLRMKAKAIGLMSADYTSDHINNVRELYTGHQMIENISTSLINQMFDKSGGIDKSDLFHEEQILPNEYFILRNGRKSALSNFDAKLERLIRVDKFPVTGIVPRIAEQTFAINGLTNAAIPLVTLTGKAGTEKTMLALAAAISMRRQYRQIFLGRPIVPLSNKDIGYLPGDIQSKMQPCMQSLYDNLGVIRDQFKETSQTRHTIDKLLTEEKLVIEPLSYIRGRTLAGIYFIVDEAQNLTPHEIKTIITRAGERAKLVFTGDIHQIDHPYLDSHSNGLSYLITKMQGQELYAHVNLEKGERSELAELASNLL